MRLWVGVTDYEWYRLHASKPAVEEVNFWRPSPKVAFKALSVGEPFLFKLHSPRNYIVGGGFFTKFLHLPVSLAWEAFGEGNGARSQLEVQARIAKYRRAKPQPHDDPRIGCVILVEPFFFPETDWVPSPPDFTLNTVVGKGYDTESPCGRDLWQKVTMALERQQAQLLSAGPATTAAIEGARFGSPIAVMPRLGQGSFRVLIMDAYGRRCSMTQEKTLPALEAAHIRPYAEGGSHELRNGLFLRRDLHSLFDLGYLTVDPDERRIVVSKRIREEYENGRDYYQLHGRIVSSPSDPAALPSRESLLYHAENKFR